ncbi:cobalamin-independent methionine synthase II family protein [Amycolatopsis pigmentata]|uniref:Cobalamin-independent methionine synthase II family protein n=1 Tax=Amycolatopsis pigmentata TaxID=450801 RepID=A0ABW5FMK5_9PSEU
MPTGTMAIARAENVGSLLRPPQLLEAALGRANGEVTAEELAKIQDAAVLEAISLQESVGLDVLTDGEMRREAWAMSPFVLDCFDRLAGARSYPASVKQATDETTVMPVVTRRVSPPTGRDLDDGYRFLRENTDRRVKFTLPAPSYHRRFWSDTLSRNAYDSCEDYLTDVRDWVRGVAARLAAAGCDYIQLDAPNYGSLCDARIREHHRAAGHDLDAQLDFDAALDSSVFAGLSGVTRAIHLCRGNLPGGAWFSSGGYAAIADRLFPALSVDVMLLEFDSDRAGDFGPLATVPAGTTAVLGLLTTKNATVENDKEITARLESAAEVKPLGELALSTQCGFASVAGGNPATREAQRAKLETVARIARQVWGGEHG